MNEIVITFGHIYSLINRLKLYKPSRKLKIHMHNVISQHVLYGPFSARIGIEVYLGIWLDVLWI